MNKYDYNTFHTYATYRDQSLTFFPRGALDTLG
jgi:hypothetical protein